MFSPEKAHAALRAKRDRFVGFQDQARQASEQYRAAFAALAEQSKAEIDAALAASGTAYPGAYPTSEHDTYAGLLVPFGQSWQNHEEARAWAMGVLTGVPTFAADGSQIQAQRDFSVPVAVVQVGWFENPHNDTRPYTKSVQVEVLAPDEFDEADAGEGGFPATEVNVCRFTLEVEKLIAYMQAQCDAPVKPLCFLDGSLVLSFTTQMHDKLQKRYIGAICNLLMVSETCQIPVIGYIDRSYAKDVLSMVAAARGMAIPKNISDATLLRLKSWGDRSHAYICARDDGVLRQYKDPDSERDLSDQVCFVYLQTTRDGPPARLDMPRWMVETGQLDQVLDIVRAECVIGNGYPYPLETADAVAVLTAEDRERFYRLFQQFLAEEQMELKITRKALSKRRRRV